MQVSAQNLKTNKEKIKLNFVVEAKTGEMFHLDIELFISLSEGIKTSF